jgi:hypothetical protein
MKTPISSKLAVTAAIVMGWTWLTALQCAPDVSGPEPTVQGCRVFYDDDFPIGGTVTRNKPAKCPFKTIGYDVIPYSATADLPANSVIYEFQSMHKITWRGFSTGFAGNAVWGQGNGRYFVNITGDYTAAIDGFDSNNGGWDDIEIEFARSYTDGTRATTRLSYTWGSSSNNITAPGSVEPSQEYPVSATTNDPLLVSPVTWSWYVDGSLVGTTTEPEFTVNAGEPSNMQQVEVVATDGNGHSVSGSTHVWVGSGCGAQLIC